MAQFEEFQFRTQPWFDQSNFPGFDQFIPMKSMVIYCFDPRTADVPVAVADFFGDEVYPGENILDEAGNRIGSTRTLFTLSNAGGRALGALQSIATMDYLFKNLERIIVVHHSFCGATSFTPDILISEFQEHYHADIEGMFDYESLAIMDFGKSIKHDIALLRASPAVPKHLQLYGFFYEMNTGKLTEIIRDLPS